MFGELRVACPVHRQVSGSQSHRELTFVHHTAPGTYLDTGCTSCVHARSESLVLIRADCNHLAGIVPERRVAGDRVRFADVDFREVNRLYYNSYF